MADFMTTLKQTVTRGAKMICRNAKKLTETVKYKTHEMNDLRKRRILIRDLGELVYKLSNDGLVLPVDAAELAKEITLLDSDLNVLRTDHAAQKAADAQLRAAEKAAFAAEKAAAKTAAAIEKSTAPVQVDIPESVIPEEAALAAEKAAAKTAAAIEKSTAPVQVDIPESVIPEKAAFAAEKAAAKTAAAIEKSTAPVQVDIPESVIPATAPAAEPEAPSLDLPAEAEESENAEVPTLKL